MVPAHAPVYFQRVFLFVVQVKAHHFVGVQSVSSSSKASPSPKSHVVGIVGIAEGHDAQTVFKISRHEAFGISVFGSHGQVDVANHSFVHAAFQTKVKHRLLIAIINACHACQVALLIVRPYLFYRIGGQVLHGRFGVANHELFAVHLNLFHLLAIDGNLPIVVYLCARNAPHQFFGYRPFRRAVSRGVVDKSIFLNHHLHGLACDLRLFQHHGIGMHGRLSHPHRLVLRDVDVLEAGDVANARKFEQIPAVGGSLQRVGTMLVRYGSGDKRAVGFQQLYRGMRHRLVRFFVYQCSCNLSFLCPCGH